MEVEGKNMIVSWIGLVHWDNGRWQNSHEKGNQKGKVNGLKVTNSLAKLGTDVLNVVHVVHRSREFS